MLLISLSTHTSYHHTNRCTPRYSKNVDALSHLLLHPVSMAIPILLYFPPFPDGKKGEQSAWAGGTAGKAVFLLPRSGNSHRTYTYNSLWAYTTHTHTHEHTHLHYTTPWASLRNNATSLSFPLHQFPMISARKVKEICQASMSVSARVAISGLVSGELRSAGDGHQPAQPSFRGCEGVTPPAPFSQAHSSSYSIFFF